MESSPRSTPIIEAVSAEQFLKHLADSGLMTEAEVTAALGAMPLAQRQDGRQIAQHLVKQGKLTPYQAQVISQGRTKGLVLGNYVILGKIGQGGMGMVFKAHHRRMDRTVALKVLPPNVTKLATAVKRFQREVQAAARLTHPNIVAAFDADESGGVHFLVMEYVEGSDLSNLVKKKGPLKPAQAVEHVLQAAAGLAHAHAAGIVHRDIKPSNLLLASGVSHRPGTIPGASQPPLAVGVVKILDMGLARIDAGTAPQAGNDELTETGNIFGTCDYMAPEQAKNAKLADGRADIYSLGCTLYYLLTGKTMYSADTSLAKLLAHQQDPIPPLLGVPASLQAVYLKMVAKKVEDRYQTMAEVQAALEDCQSELAGIPPAPRRRTGVKAMPPPGLVETSSDLTAGESQPETRLLAPRRPARRLRAAILLAGVAMVALGGAGGLLLFNPPLRAKLLAQFIPSTPLAVASSSTGTEPANTSSKESASTVKRSEPATKPAVTKPVETQPVPAKLAAPLASITLQAPVAPPKNESDGQVTAVAFSNAGMLATATRGAGLKVWDTAKLDAPFRFFTGGFEALAFSPNGRILAVGEPGGTIRHFDMDKVAERAPLEGSRIPIRAMAFTSATRLVVAQYGTGPHLFLCELLPKKSSGQPAPLKDAAGLPYLALSADGTLLAWASSASTVRVVKVATGAEVNTLKGHTTAIRSLALSPSGFQVAAGAEDGSIRVWETASGKETAVFKSPPKSATIALAFSHDGNRIASGSWDAIAHVWDIPTQRERVICKGHRNGVTAVAFSHDDKTLATGSRDATVKLWELPPPGK